MVKYNIKKCTIAINLISVLIMTCSYDGDSVALGVLCLKVWKLIRRVLETTKNKIKWQSTTNWRTSTCFAIKFGY